jgi:hypothetical protein
LITKLTAAGYRSREEAQSACQKLSAAGFACVVVRN